MSIGTVIKKLRKEKDITQEQLADYLNIPAQAVSQWECDKSAPDIYQIPVLAHIFNVSADTLLEINKKEAEIEVAQFKKDYEKLGNKGDLFAQFDLTCRMYEKYPSNFFVIDKYMWQLFYDPHYREEPFGETVHKDKLFKLCDLVIRDCPIQQIRYSAYDILGVLYLNEGNIGKAEELCSYFPESYFDTASEQLEQLYCRIDHERYAMQIRKNILYVTDHLINKIRNLGTFVTDGVNEKITAYEKCLALLGLIYDEEEIGFMLYHKGHLHCLISRLLFGINKYDEAVTHMQLGLGYCIKYDKAMLNCDSIVRHKSFVLKETEEDLREVTSNGNDNRAAYEIKEFRALEGKIDLPEEYYTLIDKYLPYANTL